MEENKPLGPLTTFGIGGPARWFAEATSEDEVVEAAAWAAARKTALFVLGGGSNVLIADAGFDGLVLRVGLLGVHVSPAGAQDADALYQVAAGEQWDSFVERAAREDCAGVECLAGIPGTVGGTPVQNVGAYGQEVAATIERVRAYDLLAREFVEFPAAECGFGYRQSRFNGAERGRYVVTRVDFRLQPGGAPTLRYADLQRALAGAGPEGKPPELVRVTEAVRRVRRGKGMLLVEGDADCRSAGSFFKNPVVTEDEARKLGAVCGKVAPRFPAGAGPQTEGKTKVPAAWLMEQAGFSKGYVLARAGISSRHTLALVNRGDGEGCSASAAEMLALAQAIREAVEQRFGLRLEMEPVLVGFEAEKKTDPVA